MVLHCFSCCALLLHLPPQAVGVYGQRLLGIVRKLKLVSRTLGVLRPAPFSLYAISAFTDGVQAKGIPRVLEFENAMRHNAVVGENSVLLLLLSVTMGHLRRIRGSPSYGCVRTRGLFSQALDIVRFAAFATPQRAEGGILLSFAIVRSPTKRYKTACVAEVRPAAPPVLDQ